MSITNCDSINQLIELALMQGNQVIEVNHSWTKMDEVIYMEKAMTQIIKNTAMLKKDLTYYRTQGSPYNKPEEGFYSQNSKVAISFPICKE